MTRPPAREGGFTLVELIVALALFGLIALAGLSLVDGVLGMERRTGARLDRLADIRRAMFVIGSDLSQVSGGPIAGGGAALSFSRPLAAAGGLTVDMRYGLSGGAMVRGVTVPGGPSGAQAMLPAVGALRFRFWTAADGWVDRWPPADDRAGEWPAAIEATLALPTAPAPGGTLRRVVVLPVRP